MNQKKIDFLKDLVSLYEKHGVTTYYDYDEVHFNVDGVYAGFPEYKGDGYLVEYPDVDRELVRGLGEKLFTDEITKTVLGAEGADETRYLPEDAKPDYRLLMEIYPDKVVYKISLTANNTKTHTYETRYKEVSPGDLLYTGGE